MSDKKNPAKMSSNKPARGIPVSKIPTSGRDSGTHSRSSSVSNLTTASDITSEAGDAASANTHGYKLEDRVWVNGSKPGYIKFLGKAEFAPGIWAGVMLDDPIGKNDGTVAGVKYFTCEPMKGIFARPQKLTRSLGPLPATGDMGSTASLQSVGTRIGSTASIRNAGSTMGSTASLKGAGLTTPTSSRMPTATSPGSATRGVCSRLRIGERIVVSSATGDKTGILRFIGETDFAKGEWAGIELDEPVGKNDGSVAGKRYFSCKMKYGLFSPLHKISRAGGTCTPRTPSVRGTPLMRSTSRDSLSSSVSNCSKSSRVKLGVTSLTSQKARITGVGIMTTSRALEEALKEKEQHIEQLLKEHDLGRAEVAKLTSRCEEIEAKSAEFQNQEQKIEEYKKDLEGQMASDKRKLEDLQFQLEEETIVKSDLELKLQQKNNVFNRLEEFLNKALDSKFTNIKEILEGKESLSEVIPEEDGSEKWREKIQELEESLTKLEEERKKSLDQLDTMKSQMKDSENNTEEQLYTLNNTIQEKDDVITNLKNELNLQLEKLTKVITDNQALAEQISIQASTEKGHTEEVIKEFGEKMTHLTEELKTKSNKIEELELCIREKDSKLVSLEDNLKIHAQQFDDIQNLNQSLNQSFDQKTSELTEKLTLQQTLEDQVATLKLQLDREISEKEKKILDLVKQIEQLTCVQQEKEDELAQKKTEITDFQFKIKELFSSATEMKIKLEQAEENATLSNKGATEKMTALQNEIILLKQEKEEMKNKLDIELQNLKTETEAVSQQLEANKNMLSKKETEITNMKEAMRGKEDECSELQNLLTSAKQLNQSLSDENNISGNNLKLKTEEFQSLQAECAKLAEEINAKKSAICDKDSEISLLMQKLSAKEVECSEIQSEVEASKKINVKLSEEKEQVVITLNSKEELLHNLQKQLLDANSLVEEKKEEATKYLKEIEHLMISKKEKEEENVLLLSKLELAEQKVEMLNKDSSEHVMTLQNELSKLKEDSDKVKTTLEQNIVELQQKGEKINTEFIAEKQLVVEKESIISKLEDQIKCKETNGNDLCNQIEKYKQDLITLEKQKLEIQESLQKQLSTTNEEFSTMLQKKEQELLELQKEKEESNHAINKATDKISEKEKTISELETQLETRKTDVNDLSEEVKVLKQKLDLLAKEKEEVEESLQEQLLVTKEGLGDELKQREEAVEKSMSKISEYEKMLETSKSELSTKEKDIASLKNTILEKESQFSELTEMIEASTLQLKQLNENNENNVKLLKNKETFINEFKSEMENKLKEREETFRTEVTNLKAIISGKEEITKQKDEIISKLNSHTEELEKQIAFLNVDLEKIKALNESKQHSSENVHKEFTDKITDLETKYLKLMEEKEKIASDELKTRSEKKKLEEAKNMLIQEKAQQEGVVKDRETQLEALQNEVNRMKLEFSLHKQELQEKLDVTLMEKEAALELKNHLDLQHSVNEELQEELQRTEEKCKKFELECQKVTSLSSDKEKLTNKIKELEKIVDEKSQEICDMNDKKLAAEELLSNSQNILLTKEKECVSLKEQMQNLTKDLESKEKFKSSFESLEEENKLLKLKMEMAQYSSDKPSPKPTGGNSNQMSDEERESLQSQIDFLNSIIVDMKQKNEELHREMEGKDSTFDENDLNFNEVKKIAPRLFCDICDMFDLHDTDDCPKQESYIDDDEEIPNLVPQGVRQMEERPYCNTCEVFGHWTLDCKEEEEY